MKNETVGIKITNKGAIMGVHMTSMSLLQLLNTKNFNIKTVDELKEFYIKELEKQIKWLDREDDQTTTQEENNEAKKYGKDTIKMIKKLWK